MTRSCSVSYKNQVQLLYDSTPVRATQRLHCVGAAEEADGLQPAAEAARSPSGREMQRSLGAQDPLEVRYELER